MADTFDLWGDNHASKQKINDTSELWVGMPEFIQEKQKPAHTMTVRFETTQDLLDFQEVLNQKLTEKTKSAWYPKKEKSDTGMKRWK